MITEYKNGLTPNPDVMCNKYVKFGGFLSFALSRGADYVATGHYAQKFLNKKTGLCEIHAGDDDNKDQSYFLWTVSQEKLKSILFPVGSLPKPQVRKIAKKAGLLTANKKDSQGLCFIGKLNIKDFLKDYIKEKEGDILNEKGEVIGKHEGIFFYTLGERHGFNIDKKTATDEPFYIVAKDVEKNTLTVSHTSPVDRKQELKLLLRSTNWISENPDKEKKYEARIRYRGSLAKAQININSQDEAEIVFEEGDFTATSGQSVVIYEGPKMIGGGIIK
jgi:tRNA-specific 2-thiouridylase